MSNEVTTGASVDAIELLESQHRQVEQLFRMMEAARAAGGRDRDEMEHVRDCVVHDLSVHAVAEEEILYPVMREALPDGDQLVQEALSEHQEIKDWLHRIDGSDPRDPEFQTAWDALTGAVRHHVEEEEQKDLPPLRARLGQERLAEMGTRLARAQEVAPTHPHPHAPNTPPLNYVAGGMAALVDRVRDAFRR